MFITNITLQNYHQFEDLVLDLTYPKNHQKAGQPLSKICFIGPNGVGKSTIMEFVMKYCNDSKITNEVKMLAIPEKIFYMPDTIAHTPKFDGVGVEVVKIGEDTQNLSKLVGSLEQEYTLLCIDKEEERQNYLFEHLNKILPIVAEMERTKDKIRMNGHFKNLDPLSF